MLNLVPHLRLLHRGWPQLASCYNQVSPPLPFINSSKGPGDSRLLWAPFLWPLNLSSPQSPGSCVSYHTPCSEVTLHCQLCQCPQEKSWQQPYSHFCPELLIRKPIQGVLGDRGQTSSIYRTVPHATSLEAIYVTTCMTAPVPF